MPDTAPALTNPELLLSTPRNVDTCNTPSVPLSMVFPPTVAFPVTDAVSVLSVGVVTDVDTATPLPCT